MVSVERILEYSRMEIEPPHKNPRFQPPESWPSKGEITFNNFKMRFSHSF